MFVVAGGGGLSAEFETEAARQSALEQMSEEARPNPSFGKFVPNGNAQPISAPDSPPLTDGE